MRLGLLTELRCHLITLILHLVQLDPQRPTQLLVCHGILKHKEVSVFAAVSDQRLRSDPLCDLQGGTCTGKTRVAWMETAAVVAINATTMGDKLRMPNKLDSFFLPEHFNKCPCPHCRLKNTVAMSYNRY